MKIISHRGNLHGRDASNENKPEYISEALKVYEVEVDVWYYKEKWYLGHDEPQYLVNEDFFKQKMWLHCKNLEAMAQLRSSTLNYFWHETDKCTLTSQGIIWCYPGFQVDGAVVVLKEREMFKNSILGICTDYPMEYKC